MLSIYRRLADFSVFHDIDIISEFTEYVTFEFAAVRHFEAPTCLVFHSSAKCDERHLFQLFTGYQNVKEERGYFRNLN